MTVSLPDGGVSQRLAFMVEMGAVERAGLDDFTEADAFVVVDTATRNRRNVSEALPPDWDQGRPLINIDHHVSNERYGTVNWIVDDAASAAELVFGVIDAAGWPVDATTASLLFAGIFSDTQSFSLATTTANTLATAAALVELGARVGEIGDRLNRTQQVSEFRLWRTAANNTHLAADNRIAYSRVSYEEIAEAGCAAADIDEQVNIPRSLAGVQIAVFFSEGIRGTTRINLRGREGVSVLELAREMGGGGHQQAAGVTLNCGLDEAIARVLPAAMHHLKQD